MIIIYHYIGYAMDLTEEVSVRLHKSQSVLTMKEICLATFAMRKSKYGHCQHLFPTIYAQFDLAPIKLAFQSGLTVDAQIGLLSLVCLFGFIASDVFADA